MKKILIFVSGMVTGVAILMVIALCRPGAEAAMADAGVTLFPTPGESLSENEFKVFQVLDSGDALAWEQSKGYNHDDITVLFYRQEGKYYYDDEIIRIPAGKCVRQIGVYKYPTETTERTVPIVEISDK